MSEKFKNIPEVAIHAPEQVGQAKITVAEALFKLGEVVRAHEKDGTNPSRTRQRHGFIITNEWWDYALEKVDKAAQEILSGGVSGRNDQRDRLLRRGRDGK